MDTHEQFSFNHYVSWNFTIYWSVDIRIPRVADYILDMDYGYGDWRLDSVPLSVRWIAGIVFQLLAPLHHDETPV